jgi:hypothetical protein
MQARENGAPTPAAPPRRTGRGWQLPWAAAAACALAVLLVAVEPSWLPMALVVGPVVVMALTRRAATTAAARMPVPRAGARLMIKAVVPVWQRQLETARSEADHELGRLLQHFVALSNTLEPTGAAATDAPHPALDLEPIYVGFQFQDRLGQMLENVSHDMQRFTDGLAEHDQADAAAAGRWLERLERSYTMEAQRRQHAAPTHPPHTPPPVAAPASQGVEFF